jgi:hypothetical protein
VRNFLIVVMHCAAASAVFAACVSSAVRVGDDPPPRTEETVAYKVVEDRLRAAERENARLRETAAALAFENRLLWLKVWRELTWWKRYGDGRPAPGPVAEVSPDDLIPPQELPIPERKEPPP